MTHTHANIQVSLQRRKTAEPARGEKKGAYLNSRCYTKRSNLAFPGGLVA